MNDHQQQPIMDDEQEGVDDSDEQPAASVNQSGKSAVYVVAYFAFLAVLMYPAQRLHLGMQGVFFAIIAAGLVLALCVLTATWMRRKIEAMQLSTKGFVQLMVGYQPERLQDRDLSPASGVSASEPESEAALTTTPRRANSSLVPLGGQRLILSGEAVDLDDQADDLPESIMEENPLYLSETFQPNANSLLGATALLCGMRRTGKSNGIAVIAEELARYYCPLCIGDTEDEYGPLSDHRYLPRGQWAGSAALLPEMGHNRVQNYIAIDLNGAYAFGQAIVRDVLQVVLHLKSFDNDDEAAQVMTEIIYGMHDWEAGRHNRERVPCTFILDEASKWLPQRLEESSILDKEVLTRLQQALFGTVVRRGGKQGSGLVLATQRIAELERALAAYQDNPLASYRELGEKLGVGKDKAGELVRELRERGMIEHV